jgi:hypothetical protein
MKEHLRIIILAVTAIIVIIIAATMSVMFFSEEEVVTPKETVVLTPTPVVEIEIENKTVEVPFKNSYDDYFLHKEDYHRTQVTLNGSLRYEMKSKGTISLEEALVVDDFNSSLRLIGLTPSQRKLVRNNSGGLYEVEGMFNQHGSPDIEVTSILLIN